MSLRSGNQARWGQWLVYLEPQPTITLLVWNILVNPSPVEVHEREIRDYILTEPRDTVVQMTPQVLIG